MDLYSGVPIMPRATNNPVASGDPRAFSFAALPPAPPSRFSFRLPQATQDMYNQIQPTPSSAFLPDIGVSRSTGEISPFGGLNGFNTALLAQTNQAAPPPAQTNQAAPPPSIPPNTAIPFAADTGNAPGLDGNLLNAFTALNNVSAGQVQDPARGIRSGINYFGPTTPPPVQAAPIPGGQGIEGLGKYSREALMLGDVLNNAADHVQIGPPQDVDGLIANPGTLPITGSRFTGGTGQNAGPPSLPIDFSTVDAGKGSGTAIPSNLFNP